MSEPLRKGYIYIRYNELCELKNIYKLGITHSGKDRETTYITSEHKRGSFILVIEIPFTYLMRVDEKLKIYFAEYNNYIDGGTEYYSKNILELIEPYIKTLGIEYRLLPPEEIETMERLDREKHLYEKKVKEEQLKKEIEEEIKKEEQQLKEEIEKEEERLKEQQEIQPYPHQIPVLQNICSFYKTYSIGLLIWACGLGKTLLSLFSIKMINWRTIIYGVPSQYLQKQLIKEIIRVFPQAKILLVGGNSYEKIKSTNNIDKIIKMLNKPSKNTKFIITTYHSCHLLVNEKIKVDVKIGDEAHHLTGFEKGFLSFHQIQSHYSLFMSATPKNIMASKECYSIDNESIFGKCIDRKSVCWAIENKKITDYVLLVLKNTEDEVDSIIRKLGISVCNKELFMSCYMCLKSFEKYSDLTHILIYTNTTEEAELAKTYIDEIIKFTSISKEELYNNSLHSKSPYSLEEEVEKFKCSRFGIISCVYIFGEGFDLPKLNGVCIAGNMFSEIRIIQSLLRPNRLDRNKPNKKAYIILPYLDTDDWEEEKKSFEKVRKIIYLLRNVDKNIEQKIHLCIASKQEEEKKERMSCSLYDDYDLEENSCELSRLKLRLRYSKSLSSSFTQEEDEYNMVRSINQQLEIKSIQEYNEKESIHSHFIKKPEDYFKKNGVWQDLYHFLGIDTTKFIPKKEEWILFCKEKNVKSLDDYNRLCEIFEELPKEPSCFYKDFTNITNELMSKRRR